MTVTPTDMGGSLSQIPLPLPALLAEAPDNHSGVITPRVLRDAMVSAAIRGPADWLYRYDSSPTAGRIHWNGAGQVQLNAVDADGIDRSAVLAALLLPGAWLRLADTTAGAYLAGQVGGATVAGGVWTVAVAPIAVAGALAVLDLVAVQVLLQTAPTGPGAVYYAQNTDIGTAQAGAPVAVDPAGGGVVLAVGTSTSAPAVGLMQLDTAPAAVGAVLTDGLLTLASWAAVTGAAALPARSLWFLDPSAPGQLTATPPAAPGTVLQPIGRAVGPLTMLLRIGQPIAL